MALLNVSEVLLSPEFMQPVKVYRNDNGRWEKGLFKQDEETLFLDMLVSPVNEKVINMIPEADRIKDAKTFHCLDELYITSANGEARTSDMLEWKGNKYKIVSIADYSDYGYYKAFAVMVRGY